MVGLVLDEAGLGNARLLLEHFLIPVSCPGHNGCLTDLAHHKHLQLCVLSFTRFVSPVSAHSVDSACMNMQDDIHQPQWLPD